MNPDIYTKIILTVIAGSLATIAIENAVKPAHAQMDGPVHVIVDQIGGAIATLPLPVAPQQ